MDKEFCFLIGCIRAYFTNTPLPEHGNICWTKLFQRARNKKVMLFLCHILQKHIHEPDLELQKRYKICQRKKRRNLFLAMELVKLNKACRQQNVEIVCFKGPVLADLAYGNLALRDFNDIDILIDKNDIQKVEEILQQQGLKSFVKLNSYQRQKLLIDYHHPILWIKKQYSIDVHLQLHPKYFDVHPFEWKDNLQKSFADILTLSNEVYIVYLCTHAARHCWDHLTPIIDIAIFIRKFPNLNWEKAMNYAQKKNSLHMFCRGIALCHKLTGIHLPDKIISQIHSNHKLQLQISVLEHDIVINRVQKSLRNIFCVHDSLFVNMRTCWSFIWTPLPVTVKKINLPSGLYVLYPLIQIVSFVYQLPTKFFNLFLRSKQNVK